MPEAAGQRPARRCTDLMVFGSPAAHCAWDTWHGGTHSRCSPLPRCRYVYASNQQDQGGQQGNQQQRQAPQGRSGGAPAGSGSSGASGGASGSAAQQVRDAWANRGKPHKLSDS